MARLSVALVALSSVLLIGSVASAQENPQLRASAVSLLEHAVANGQPPTTTPFNVLLTFQWFGEVNEQSGQIAAAVVPGVGYKRIYDLGDYHAEISLHQDGTAMTIGDPKNPPEPIRMASVSSTPGVMFDHEDVIQSINSSTVNGRPAHCIQFQTTFGDKHEQNEACVDAQNGTLLHLVVGDRRTEYSDWRPFSGSFYPAQIELYRSEKLLMTIAQHVTTLAAPEHALDMPPEAMKNRLCRQIRRAFGQNMPQPPAGLPGAPVDIAVHGMIGRDGHVHDAAVEGPGQAGLNSKALEIADQWTFTPAVCDGTILVEQPMTIVLHFR